MKELWTDPGYRNKMLKASSRKPTRPEIKFNEITPKTVYYVGNHAWWRKLPNGKYKNPDFKITNQNKVIEIFGNYWHRGEDPQKLIKLYAQVGLECLIIWENEIYQQPQGVINKVYEFIS